MSASFEAPVKFVPTTMGYFMIALPSFDRCRGLDTSVIPVTISPGTRIGRAMPDGESEPEIMSLALDSLDASRRVEPLRGHAKYSAARGCAPGTLGPAPRQRPQQAQGFNFFSRFKSSGMPEAASVSQRSPSLSLQRSAPCHLDALWQEDPPGASRRPLFI